MISKVSRVTRTFAIRYGGVGDHIVRNIGIASNNVSHLSVTQKVFPCPIKCRSWRNYVQNMQYSTEKTRQPILDVNYSDIKDLPNHPEKLLIDVREPDELVETGKIPTSINIPLACVVQVLAEDVKPQRFQSKYGRRKPGFDDEIIFTCKLGKRALKAAEIANAMGFTNVKYYPGSWEDWIKNEKEKHAT
ncbi:rhodanese domain-containing protein CG4456 [Anastrepha ludens]|uniref:rhodanese domain-containing protein CG4456 n=1 Tax=Anastrepha ludens TaxID=28586 RepID=UPI0023B0B9CC|nr:rhodanese domain-containing protein CG4456 [Anastrepha ludens]